MAVPKGFRKDIRLVKDNVGFERRQEILDGIANQGTFLPRGVGYEDMDGSFIDYVNEDLSINIEGERVPVIFLTLQRWNEFSRTWKFTDEHKDIKLPFITIVRQPNPQVGTNQNGWWNIPGRRNYTYYKVPTWDGNRKGIDVYKIPQPTSVDINYEVRFFTNRMSDLNILNALVQHKFKSRQDFIYPNGHPMPVHLENIGDESNISNFQERRFYVQPYEMLLKGYLLDEEHFEVTPAINRLLVLQEIADEKPVIKINKENKIVTYDFVLNDGVMSNFTITTEFDINFTDLNIINGITNIDLMVDGVSQTIPFSVPSRTDIKVMVTKPSSEVGRFTLKGKMN